MSRPIAGTRKRGRDDDHDRRLAGSSRRIPKVAEHVMLVDLARNDVGPRVAHQFGARRRLTDPGALQPRHAPPRR
ncbi:MAG: chorismate-binding protein [Ilumatobacteraceae bacterium]